jgi:hypothetical protein
MPSIRTLILLSLESLRACYKSVPLFCYPSSVPQVCAMMERGSPPTHIRAGMGYAQAVCVVAPNPTPYAAAVLAVQCALRRGPETNRTETKLNEA